MRSLRTEMKSSPCSLQLEKSPRAAKKTNAAKNKLINLKKKKKEEERPGSARVHISPGWSIANDCLAGNVKAQLLVLGQDNHEA